MNETGVAKSNIVVPQPICPHCRVEIKKVEWMRFGDKPEDITIVVYCGNCLKVIGVK